LTCFMFHARIFKHYFYIFQFFLVGGRAKGERRKKIT
jgi:hypothetical protein